MSDEEGYTCYWCGESSMLLKATEYEVVQWLGKGAYGLVCQARDIKNDRDVAIKKITFNEYFETAAQKRQALLRVLREVRMMRHFNHENIVKLSDIIRPKGTKEITELYLVMDLMGMDLWSFLHPPQKEEDSIHLPSVPEGAAYGLTWGDDHTLGDILAGSVGSQSGMEDMAGRKVHSIDGKKIGSHDELVRRTAGTGRPTTIRFEPKKNDLEDLHKLHIMYQLLCAVGSVHAANTMHRDLKPHNVLIDTYCNVKLCDFGLAREMEGETLTCYVETRWYRAPELIVEYKNYDHKVDVWSLGCILAELFHPNNNVLLEGKSAVHQLRLILDMLGLPSEEELTEICGEEMTEVKKHIMEYVPQQEPATLHSDPQAADLLANMLRFTPTTRYNVQQCMDHPFFDGYKEWAIECELELEDDFSDVKPFPAIVSSAADSSTDEQKLQAATGLLVEEIRHYHSSFTLDTSDAS